jgi:hypothetical protein
MNTPYTNDRVGQSKNTKIAVRCTFELLPNHLATTNSSVLCTFYSTQSFICKNVGVGII